MKIKVLKGGLLYNILIDLSGEIVGKILILVASIYLARTLGTKNYGVWSIASVVLAYLFIIVDCGLTIYGTRHVSYSLNRIYKTIGNIIVLRLSLAIIVSSIIFIITMVVSKYLYNEKWIVVFGLLSILTINLIAYSLTLDWLAKGIKRFDVSSFSFSISSLVFLIGCIFVSNGSEIYKVAIIKSVSSVLMAVIIAIWLINIRAPTIRFLINKISPKSWSHILRESIFIAGSAIMAKFYFNLDILIIGIYWDASMVGIYSGLGLFFTSALVIRAGLISVLLPHLSSIQKKGKKAVKAFVNRSSLYGMAIGLLLIVFFLLFGKYTVLILLGDDYLKHNAEFVLIILMTTAAFMFINLLPATLLYTVGLTRHVFIITSIGAATNIIGNILYIPLYGMKAAALTTLLSEIIVALGCILVAKQKNVY